jgi:guanylate kinase
MTFDGNTVWPKGTRLPEPVRPNPLDEVPGMVTPMSGILVVLTGPAGSGKDTLTQLLERDSALRKFPSVTTRPMRSGESQGRPYTFLRDSDFDALRDAEGLLNDVLVGGYRYGIQRDTLQEAYANGACLILHLTRDWALKVRSLFANTVLVLVKAPSVEEQTRRLRMRGHDEQEITRRLVDKEVQNPPEEGFDLVLVNETDRLDETYAKLMEFLYPRLKHCREPAEQPIN